VTTTTMSPPSALRQAAGRRTAERFAAWAHSLGVEDAREPDAWQPVGRRNGAFAVTASESIAAPVERLYAAFAAPDVRRRWLAGVAPQPTALRPGRSARFEWADGAERVDVTFTATAEAEGWVTVEHTRLPSGQAAADAKTYWQDRLATLRDLLED
jgi:hypothetical protein